jgi:hypothetical protein
MQIGGEGIETLLRHESNVSKKKNFKRHKFIKTTLPKKKPKKFKFICIKITEKKKLKRKSPNFTTI